jgi:excisionase family DNA binding protein
MAKIRSTRPLWVDVAEAARLLNMDRRTVLRLVEEGKLRSRTDLDRVLVRYDDVDRPIDDDGASHGSWCSSDSTGDDPEGDQLKLEVGA